MNLKQYAALTDAGDNQKWIGHHAATRKSLIQMRYVERYRQPIEDGRTVFAIRRTAAGERVLAAPPPASKLDQAMTCQCCGRAIHAATGNIAHHGYQRPGEGFQTASCMGAKYPPFEVSRDRLGEMLTMMAKEEAQHVARLAELEAGDDALKVVLRWDVHRSGPRKGYGERVACSVSVNASEYAEWLVNNPKITPRAGRIEWWQLVASAYRETANALRELRVEITGQRERYDGWRAIDEREAA